MSLDDPPRPGRALRMAAAWLDASPSEVVGLVVLLAGSLAVTGLLWLRPAPPGGPPEPSADRPDAVPTGRATLMVHVAGAVVAPGIVELPEGGRVADAVALAGGMTAEAAPDGLNLARPVSDGEQITVPVRSLPGDAADGGTADAAAETAFGADGRLDLNRATAADLEELPGIGPVLAERIIAWREQHGPFTDPGQLRDVPGIGERTFQTLAEHVSV